MSYTFNYTLPEEEGISSLAILKWLDRIKEEKIDLHSFMILRHHQVLAEGYYHPYKKDDEHLLYSLSKSFVSMAIGFALQENRLSLDDYMVDYLDLPNTYNKAMDKIKISHLLTMSTGHCKEPYIYDKEDMVEAFLNSDLEYQPGTTFLYNTPATYILSCIITKITGLSVEEYLKPRLFDPLGITNHPWLSDKQGRNMGGYGLSLSLRDLAKFGLFLLNKGTFNGQQLINPKYIEEATSFKIDTSSKVRKDWKQGYGYQFWMCSKANGYRGDGLYGQYCIIFPHLDLVIVMQSGLLDLQKPIDLVYEELLPNFTNDRVDQTIHTDLLRDRLKHLEIEHDHLYQTSIMASFNHSLVFEMEDNELGIKQVSFNFKQGNQAILTMDENTHVIHVGYHDYANGTLEVNENTHHSHLRFYKDYSAIGGFASGRFCFKVVYTKTPFIDEYSIGFNEDTIDLYYKRNIEEKEKLYKGKLKKR